MTASVQRQSPGKRLTRLSSASPLLHLTQFDGKTIDQTYKGTGNARIFQFTDGTRARVTRSDVAELARLHGYLASYRRYKGETGARKTKKGFSQAKIGTYRAKLVGQSTKRQRVRVALYVQRLKRELGAAPASMRKQIQSQIRRVQRAKVGSPLTGHTPASAVISGGAARTFGLAKRAGIQFRTVGKGKNRRVFPVSI